jgi:hypothetical protein
MSNTELDRISTEYSENDPTMLVDRRFMGLLADHVLERVQGGPVLEMGIGLDVWTGKIVSRFGSSTVVEASGPLIETSRHKFPEVRYV